MNGLLRLVVCAVVCAALFPVPVLGQAPTQLAGHTAPINAAIFARDGKDVVTCSSDQTIKIWDAATGAELRTLGGHTEQVLALAASPDGRFLVSGAADNTLRLWDIPQPQPLRAFAGHTGGVNDLALAPGGLLLVTASDDATVRIWDPQDGQMLGSLEGHTASVLRTAVRGDNVQLATADAGGTIRLWNPVDYAPQDVLEAHAGSVTGLAFHPNNQQLISAGEDGALRLWQLPVVPPRTLEGNTGPVRAVALTSDSQSAVIADGPAIRVFPLTGEEEPRELPDPPGPSECLATSGDNAVAAAGGPEGIVKLWNLADGADRFRIGAHEGAVRAIDFHPDNARFASAGDDGVIRLWKLPGATAAIEGVDAAVTVAATSGDGRLTATAGPLGGQPAIWVRDVQTGKTVAEMQGHSAVIQSLAFSPDNKKLLSGAADKTARVWDLSDPKFPEILKIEHAAAVTAVAFSPDGAQVFTGGTDGAIRQWSLADGEEVRAMTGHTGPVSALAVAGTTLVSGGADSTVRLWNTSNGSAIRTINHGAAVTAVALRADGTKVASGGADKLVKLWEAADGAAVATMNGHADAIASVAIQSDAERVASGSTGGVRIWDFQGRQLERFTDDLPGAAGVGFVASSVAADKAGHVVACGTDNSVHVFPPSLVAILGTQEAAVDTIAFTPDGNSILSGGADGSVRLWNVADGTLVRQYTGGEAEVTSVAVTADTTRVVAAAADNMVRVWPFTPPPPEDGTPAPTPPEGTVPAVELQWTLEHPAPVRAVSTSPDNQKVAASGDDSTVRVWDLAGGQQLEQFTGEAAVLSVAFAGDSRTILSGAADGSVRLQTLSAVRAIAAHEGPVRGLALVAGGAQAATAGEDGPVRLWNLGNGEVLREFTGGEAAYVAVAARGDNAQLAAADAEATLYLWNAGDATLTTSFKAPAEVHALGYSPDNQKLLAACEDNAVRSYKAEDGTLLDETVSDQPVLAAAFTPDSRQILTGGGQGAVSLWAYASPEALRTMTGHGDDVFAVAYSPDGKRIASASKDQTVRLWDAETGNQLKQFTGHQGSVYGVAFSPDGSLLVSCGADGTVRLWDAISGQQLKQILASDSALYSVDFHSDGRRVAAAGVDKVIRLLDTFTGNTQASFEGHEDFVQRVALNAAGTRLLSCGYGGKIVVWNVAGGQPLFEQELERVADDARLAPDGARIVVAGGDGVAYFVDVPAAAR